MLLGCLVNLLIWAVCAMIVIAIVEWIIPLIFETAIPARITQLVRILVVLIVLVYFLGCLGVLGIRPFGYFEPYRGS